MLGGVPISVVMPPRSDAKARGIRKREGGSLLRPDTLIATGMRSVTAPTLFMKAERNAVRPVSDAIRAVKYGGMRDNQLAITSTTPDS